MSNVWLKLSGQYIMFGRGGVVRVATERGFNETTQKPFAYTQLYTYMGKTGYVDETVEEIMELLGDARAKSGAI